MIWAGTLGLLALLALAFDSGRLIARRVLGEREPLAVAAWAFLAGVSLFGTALNLCLRAGLRTGGGTVAAAAVLGGVRFLLTRWPPARTEGPEPLARWERAVVIGVGVLAIVPMAWVLAVTDMWDEWGAHLSFAESIANGAFPPVDPFLPDVYLTYHFGFDLLTGTARRLTGHSLEHTFDILSVSLFAAFYLAAGATVRRAGGRRLVSHLLPAALLWMGGLAWLRVVGHPERLGAAVAKYTSLVGPLDGFPVHASSFSYFFQKPMSLGLPLMLLSLAMFQSAMSTRAPRAAALGGILLSFVEMSEYPAFLMALATVAVLGALRVAQSWWRGDLERARARLAVGATFVGMALLFAFLNGSFFANPSGRVLHVTFKPYVPYWEATAGTQGSPYWQYLWQMGLPAVLAPATIAWVIWRRSEIGLWLATFATGSLLAPHLFHYERTNDMAKFLNLASIGFGLLIVIALASESRRLRPVALRVVVLALFVIGLAGHAPFFMSYVAARAERLRPKFALDEKSADWLRTRAGAYDRVLASRSELSSLGGLLTPIPPRNGAWRIQQIGYDPTLSDYTATAVVRALADLNPLDLGRLGIRWVYLDEVDLAALRPEGRVRLASPSFRLEHEEKAASQIRRVYRYVDGPPALPER